MKRTAYKNRELAPVLVLGISLLISVLVSLIGCVFTAYMISGGKFGEAQYGTASFILWMLSAFSGTMISGMLMKEKRLLMIGISALLYLLFLLGMHILVFEGEFMRIGQGILAILFGSIPSILICLRQNSGKQRKIKYRR